MQTQHESTLKETREATSFKLNQFIIKEAHIIRNTGEPGKYNLKFNPKGYINEQEQIFMLELEIEVKDIKDTFEAKVKILSWFEFDNKIKKDNLNKYFYQNAPAIIFPYIRAYISSLTALSGLPAINLPLMNMLALGKELSENTVTIEPVNKESELI